MLTDIHAVFRLLISHDDDDAPLLLQYRPLIWRNTHPYILIDRHEDITDPNNDNDDQRNVVVYGYVRGTQLKPHMKVHLIGVGDYDMKSVTALPDPLPAAATEKEAERKVRNSSSGGALQPASSSHNFPP